MKYRLSLVLAIVAAAASAQVSGMVPQKVVIYVHADMPNIDFVETLVAAHVIKETTLGTCSAVVASR